MKSFLCFIEVFLQSDVLDVQGQAIRNALASHGHDDVKSVRVGKKIEIRLQGENKDAVTEEVKAMAKNLLVNEVIEDFRITVQPE